MSGLNPSKAVRYLATRRPVPLYHGTSAKDATSFIRAMAKDGIVPRRGSGHGQGDGFYSFTDRAEAASHARALASGDPGFRTSRPPDGVETPIVVVHRAALNPQDYDLDYEVQSGDVMSFLASQQGPINELLSGGKIIADTPSTLDPLPLHGMYVHPAFKKDPQAGLGFWLEDPDSLDLSAVQLNDNTNIYLRGGSVYDAGDMAGIVRAIGSGSPEIGRDWNAYKRAIMKRQSEGRASPRAYKYVGDRPIRPSGIYVREGVGWKDGLLGGLVDPVDQ